MEGVSKDHGHTESDTYEEAQQTTWITYSWKPPILRKASTTRRYSASSAGTSLIRSSSAVDCKKRGFGGAIRSMVGDVMDGGGPS